MSCNVKDTILKVNKNVFDYKLKELPGDLCSIMDSVNTEMHNSENIDRNSINNIFRIILDAMEKHDYLLIADILKYELLPIVDVL